MVYTVLYTFIISGITSNTSKLSLGIYICLGIIHWTLFQDVIIKTMNMFSTYANFIKGLNFPKITLPIIVLLDSFFNYLISIFLLILFVCFIQEIHLETIVILLLIAIWLGFFGTFLGVILCILSTFFRDIKNSVPILMQIWFWLTPIAYLSKNNNTFDILNLNPLFYFFNIIQDLFISNELLDSKDIFIIFSINFFIFCIAFILSKIYINKTIDNI
jgi:lipopolysaccharide transport system permease protein